MLQALKSIFRAPRPTGEPRSLRRFGPTDTPITQDGLGVDEGGWRLDLAEARTVRLFELPVDDLGSCLVTYRAQMKSRDLKSGAYLEMWCRLPGRGEFFSKGLHSKLTGTSDWATLEVPFYLRKNQRPDLLKLNVVCEGPGAIWIRNIEVLSTPLAA